MSMLEQLNADMKTAMKNREKEKLTVIRMVKSSLQNEAIKKQADLTEEEELQVLSREVKQRNDSLHEFRKLTAKIWPNKLKTSWPLFKLICQSSYLMKN